MLHTVATIKNSKGFTLIELIVSLGLLSLIITAIFAMFSMTEKAFRREDGRLDAQQNVRQALLWLSTAIRQARNVEIISEDEIKITTSDGGQIIFYFQNGVLYRKRNAGTNPIAELSDLKFIQSKDKYYIELLLSTSFPFEELTVKTKVTPFGTCIN